MQFLKEIASLALPGWGERVISQLEIEAFLASEGVKLVKAFTDSSGHYVIHRGIPWIVIEPELAAGVYAWVLAHETGHHLFHIPAAFHCDTKRMSKAEYEANVFAAIALIPLSLMQSHTRGEIQEEYGYPNELLDFRLRIYDNFKC